MKLPVSNAFIAIVITAAAIAAYAQWSSKPLEAGNAEGLVAVRHSRVMGPTVAQSPRPPAEKADIRTRLEELRLRAAPSDVDDLFSANLPPPLPPVRRAASRPTPPPIPYVYMGALVDGDSRTVFLSSPDERVIVAKADQVIDGLYHVERVDAKTLTVNYLPLHQTQTIALDRAP